MTGKRVVKEEAVEIAAVREVKRMIEGRETETAETEIAETGGIDEIAEKAEMTKIIEETGMKEMTEIAGENPGRVKTQKESQRVVAGREIAVQGA